MRTVVDALGCEAVVTVGSAAEAVPHTRVPLVTASTTDAELARRLGIGQPTYQGVTGMAGVLLADLGGGRRAVGVVARRRAALPRSTPSTRRRWRRCRRTSSHVLNVPVPADDGELAGEIKRWRTLHDEVVANDAQLQLYVRMLEHEHDRRAEASIPSADDIGAQFEQYLREKPRRLKPPIRRRAGRSSPVPSLRRVR